MKTNDADRRLTPVIARKIIEPVGASGVPPEYGFQYFTSGLDPYLSVLRNEYLETFLKGGGAAFKMVVGVYGGGKTHFLYAIRDLAWENRFVVSYVSLSPGESPFHRLELVYRSIVGNLVPPLPAEELLSGYERGIGAFIRVWYEQKREELLRHGIPEEQVAGELASYLQSLSGVDSLSFLHAVRAAFRAIGSQNDEEFDIVLQWVRGEGYDSRVHRKRGILQKIDKTTAFTMIRSLAQWIREIGYSGIVILLDEAERVPSLSSRQKEAHLNNLREVIDECGRSAFNGVMVFYAVPDENFLEGRTQVYEALRQRVTTVFDELNFTGVKIQLEKVVDEPVPFLVDVGQKLSRIYEVAYSCALDPLLLPQTVEQVAKTAYDRRYGDIGYKRLFVQGLVKALHVLHRDKRVPDMKELGL